MRVETQQDGHLPTCVYRLNDDDVLFGAHHVGAPFAGVVSQASEAGVPEDMSGQEGQDRLRDSGGGAREQGGAETAP